MATATPVFNEKAYLEANPDVASALQKGTWGANNENKTAFTSGEEFYNNWGKAAGRTTGAYDPITPTAPLAPNAPKQNTLPVYNATADIKAMSEARKAAKLAELGKANQSALSNLGAEQAKIAPEYYNQRNNTSTSSQIAAKNFAEYMAQRGQNNATGINGTMAQNEISSNVALQGNLGRLNTAEAGANADIARRTTDINNAYASDIASANAGVDADTMSALIAAQQRYNDTQLNQSNVDRTYNYQVGRDTVTDANNDRNYNYQVGRDTVTDTGYNNGTQTIAGKQADASIANTTANTQGQLISNQYQPQIYQGQIDSTNINTQLAKAELQEKTDPNSVTNQLAQLGLDTAKLNYSYLPQQLQTQAQLILQQLAKGTIDIQTAQVQLNYLPQQLQTGIDAQLANIRQGDAQVAIAQQNANTNAAQAAKSSSGGSSSSSSSSAAYNDAAASLLAAQDKGQATTWLNTYKNDLIAELGADNYTKLVKNFYDANTNTANDAKYRQANRNT